MYFKYYWFLQLISHYSLFHWFTYKSISGWRQKFWSTCWRKKLRKWMPCFEIMKTYEHSFRTIWNNQFQEKMKFDLKIRIFWINNHFYDALSTWENEFLSYGNDDWYSNVFFYLIMLFSQNKLVYSYNIYLI